MIIPKIHLQLKHLMLIYSRKFNNVYDLRAKEYVNDE